MFSDGSEHSVPFLGYNSASAGGRRHEGGCLWKAFASRCLWTRAKSAATPELIGWPGIVILGQLTLQTSAWGFFLLLQYRGGIALPYELAAWAKANPHTVEWVSTQLATILAFLSTLLFSWGVRQSITLRLRGDGMTFAAFISFIHISARSLILNPRKLKFSLISLSIIILTGVQTAGWSALITPRAVVINTALIGHEIDLSSPLLEQMQNNDALTYCVLNATSGPSFMVGQTESGYAAVKGHLSFPATFTLMDQSFNLSTGGILPLTLSSLNASTWFFNATTIPATVRPAVDLPKGLGSSYSLNQQGFTADVSCQFQDPKEIPGLFFTNNTVRDWIDTQNLPFGISYSDLYSDILLAVPFLNSSVAYTLVDSPNYILMVACPSPDNYQLIFYADQGGIYRFMKTTVCTVSPKITNVDVRYSDAINTWTRPNAKAADVLAAPTLSALATLYEMVYFSQAIVSNSMGDKLSSLIAEVDGNTFTEDTTLRTTEEYIRGVTQFSASVFRACLSSNKDFLDALPSSMTVPTSGMYYSDTIGWLRASHVTFLELLPGTIVAFLTIYAVVVAVARHARDPKGDYFDPSDPMHLVAASAAGDLNNVFMGTKEKDIIAVEDVNVSLNTIPGRGPVLIHGTV
ncbi:hypothetical protein MVEN_01124200 [Mycena venus]|uniref:Uncharacterized protein n=1 Tax=Mycena venus TaxID=2733690 RepID=A0A8H7D074_9AGAR|nr:hypothetical protein MVEN_01124200 [Mycena venus]